MSMTVQEPQLLDKMENVAYRLNIQAGQRKKHMNSRYCHACCMLMSGESPRPVEVWRWDAEAM